MVETSPSANFLWQAQMRDGGIVGGLSARSGKTRKYSVICCPTTIEWKQTTGALKAPWPDVMLNILDNCSTRAIHHAEDNSQTSIRPIPR